MGRDKDAGVAEKMETAPVCASEDMMTVDDYARVSKVNAIMLAGFKSFMKRTESRPWRTLAEWQQAMDTFAKSPA